MRAEEKPECERCSCRGMAVQKHGNDPCALGGGDFGKVALDIGTGTADD